jgi:hypothetical protein
MAASWLINVANSAGKESPNPDISFFALSANNPERRLAVEWHVVKPFDF